MLGMPTLYLPGQRHADKNYKIARLTQLEILKRIKKSLKVFKIAPRRCQIYYIQRSW